MHCEHNFFSTLISLAVLLACKIFKFTPDELPKPPSPLHFSQRFHFLSTETHLTLLSESRKTVKIDPRYPSCAAQPNSPVYCTKQIHQETSVSTSVPIEHYWNHFFDTFMIYFLSPSSKLGFVRSISELGFSGEGMWRTCWSCTSFSLSECRRFVVQQNWEKIIDFLPVVEKGK